jgi:hypothetical protein
MPSPFIIRCASSDSLDIEEDGRPKRQMTSHSKNDEDCVNPLIDDDGFKRRTVIVPFADRTAT